MERQSGQAGPARPRVVVSVSASVDGRVTLRRDTLLMDEGAGRSWQSLVPAPPSGAGPPPEAAHQAAPDNPEAQAVLEGSGSLVHDAAGPLAGLPTETEVPEPVLYSDFLPEAVVDRPGHEKWFTVVDSRGRVRWDTKSDGGFDVLVLTARATPAAYLAYLRRERICYLVAGGGRVDLAAALRRMRERLGVTCVVSSAGGGLNGALLRAGLVDEVQVSVLPAAIGGRGTPTVFDGPELAPGESPTRLRLLSAHVETNGLVWLRYDVQPRTAARHG